MKNNNNKEYIRWKETRKRKRIMSVIGIALITAGAGVGVGYAIWHNSKSNPTPTDGAFDIVRYKTDKTPESGILKDDGDQIVLMAVNGDGEITWDGLNQIDTIPGLHYDDSVPSMLRIYVQGSTKSEAHVTITAKDQAGGVASDVVQIYKFTPKPVTTDYFKTTETEHTGIQDTIIGFTDEVIQNPNILNVQGFNTLDFTGTDIKYITGDCSFPSQIFKTWKVEVINFNGLTFSPFNGVTGLELFAYANLSSLIELNFGSSVWYYDFGGSLPDGETHTADKTFQYANLSGLSHLKFSGTKFATARMLNDGSIYTADKTFYHANLSGLSDLDLSGAEFASSNMSDSGLIYTANSMFDNTVLPRLTNLNLKGAKFADSNMIINAHSEQQSKIFTASDTFYGVYFLKLVNLNLNDASFATDNMSTNAEVDTAHKTFNSAQFMELSNLELSGAKFASDNMTLNGDVFTASSTFMNAIFWKLDILSLDGAIFAANQMTNQNVHTAGNTFMNTDFSKLTTLNLSGAIFVASNMTTGDSSFGIYTASATFAWADLSTLNTLDLDDTVFAMENMTTNENASICTAHRTFDGSIFQLLHTLTLTSAVFALNGMMPASQMIFPAARTFQYINFLNLKDLYLTKPYNFSTAWSYTFWNEPENPEQIVIHNYGESADAPWFTYQDFFPDCTWSLS